MKHTHVWEGEEMMGAEGSNIKQCSGWYLGVHVCRQRLNAPGEALRVRRELAIGCPVVGHPAVITVHCSGSGGAALTKRVMQRIESGAEITASPDASAP